MRRFIVTVALAAFFLVVSGSKANAQTISFNKNSPVIGPGTVSGAGPFDCGAGNVIYIAKLYVKGANGTFSATYNPKQQTQTGSWTASRMNIPTGSYNISVELNYQDQVGMVFKKTVNAPNNPYDVP